ncbi:prolyl oligopeptidase family serine peptidase [Sphingomonas crusticola]|uniref:prolyl oligopeptidase family serine peptidase n=1 Tax=Sphingomonas crusticola TaxID=1697973 RepID=UPI001F07681B|nr:prolyl oligopeptidase family serine peptidase [Sphingomonas crusticola]
MVSPRRRLLAAALLASLPAMSVAADPVPANDPYIWLEQISSPESLAWVESENKRSLAVLETDPRFAGLYADAVTIAEATDRIPMPNQIGDQITNFWQDAGHVHGIWRTTSAASYLTATPRWRTLLDLDALSTAENTGWVWKGANCEPVGERLCLLNLSNGGEDATTLREFDFGAGSLVAGGFSLPTSKQGVAWEGADSLLVARDWGPGTMTASSYPFVIKRLRRGQPLDQAVEIFRGKASDVSADPTSLVDGDGNRLVVIERGVTFFESELFVVDGPRVTKLDLPTKFRMQGFAANQLLLRIDQDWKGLKAGSLVGYRIAGGKVAEQRLLFAPGPRQSIDEVATTRGHVLAVIYDNVRGQAWSFAPTARGWTTRRIALPDNASVGIVSTDRLSEDAYLNVQSFTVPTTLWLANATEASARQIKAMPSRFNAAGLVTEQFEATSKDGTRIPYFVVHRADIKYDGSTPTLLNAYGGFQVSETPVYQGLRGKLWLERGGAYVLANIRGGGEFGPAWHEAGLKTKRQVIYDDFAGVAEDLIKRGITSPRRLGIYGGSNGGLLMGVEMTQRPDLWNAVAIQIPLLDMLRYEKLSAGSSWVGEYGSVSVPAERAFWEKTSPYQALRKGAKYPEPFIWTTTKDDRVGPVQARKFAARMKEYGLPYLYWENTEGGHAAGANLKQAARAVALEITYFTRKLMDPVEPPSAPVR